MSKPSQNVVTKLDKRIVQSRAAICEALLDLLGSQKLRDITATMIADRAGVGYATFFRHYANTEMVLLEVSEKMIQEISAAMLPALLSRDANAAMRMVTEYVENNRALSYAMLISAGASTQQTMINYAIAQHAPQSPDADKSLPQELVARLSVSSIITILAWWLERAPHQSAEEVARYLRKFVIDPVAD